MSARTEAGCVRPHDGPVGRPPPLPAADSTRRVCGPPGRRNGAGVGGVERLTLLRLSTSGYSTVPVFASTTTTFPSTGKPHAYIWTSWAKPLRSSPSESPAMRATSGRPSMSLAIR